MTPTAPFRARNDASWGAQMCQNRISGKQLGQCRHGEPGEMEYWIAQMHCISLPCLSTKHIIGSYLQLTEILQLGYTTNLRLAGFLNHQQYQPVLTKTPWESNLPPLIRLKKNTPWKSMATADPTQLGVKKKHQKKQSVFLWGCNACHLHSPGVYVVS